MRKSVCLTCVGLFIVIAVEGVFAQAGLKDTLPGKWWTKRPIIKELNLSVDQLSKIEACWQQRNKVLMGQQEILRKRQQELAELVAKESIDETAAMKLLDEVQQLRANLERNTFLMRIQIKNLLTPDQQRKTEEIAERLRLQKAKEEAAAPVPEPQKNSSKKKAGLQPDLGFLVY